MRTFIALPILATLIGFQLPAATVAYSTSVLTQTGGTTLFQYNFFLSNIDFLANQALDITFPANNFSQLSNGVAGQGFDLLLLQPNSPPQAAGVYSALALSSHPSISQLFSVNALFLGSGVPGPPLSYSIDQFDPQGKFLNTILTGTTVPVAVNTPEPSTVFSAALVLLLGYAICVFRVRGFKISPSKAL